MKLAIGTAQFGLAYGIANRSGRTTIEEAAAVLRLARAHGIDTVDTAIAYGDSEARLGALGIDGWHVVSKLPGIPAGCPDVGAWTAAAVRESLDRLRIPRLYGLLLHRPGELLDATGAALYAALSQLKDDGLVGKIGVSVYEPSELALVDRFAIDLVQAPLNVLDRRLVRSGWLSRLREGGIEVHARSVFLQGLLLMTPSQRPAAFGRWDPVWTAYDRWVAGSGLTRLEACLRYALSCPGIERVVVGVDHAGHLAEILAAADGEAPPLPDALDVDDPVLLNPARWALTA